MPGIKDPERMRELARLGGARKREGAHKRKQQAYEDYLLLGPNRSLNQLLNYYRSVAQKAGPEAVPTLARNTLFKWAREGHWEEKAKAHDLKTRGETLLTLESSRKAAVTELSNLLGMAVGVVHRVLGDPSVPAHTRLQAAKLVFELTGISLEKAEPEGQPQEELPPPPSPDAGVVEFEEYLRKLVAEGRR